MSESPNGSGVQPAGTESVDTGSSEVNYQQVLDGAQQRSIDNAEINLARRAEEKLQYAEGNLELESALQSVQKQIYDLQNGPNVDHLKMMQLQSQAQLLAERITSNGFDQDDFDSRYDESVDHESDYNSTDDLIGKYGESEVNETLYWAADGGISKESAEAFNSFLNRNDESSTQAYEALRQIKNNPGYVNREENIEDIGADLGLANELAEQYGKAGQQLAAISHAIATGKCTRGEATQMVLSNPEIAQAAFSAAQQGLITLAL